MEYHKTTLIVIESEGRFLLLRRAIEPELGRWCFPGGHKEPDETIQEAAKREAEEEIGMKVELETYDPFFIFEHPFGRPDHIHRCHCFRARVMGDRKSIKINHESSDFGWFTPDETKRLQLTEYTKTAVNKLKEISYAAGTGD